MGLEKGKPTQLKTLKYRFMRGMDESKYSKYFQLLSQASVFGLSIDPKLKIQDCERFLEFCEEGTWLFSQGNLADHLYISLDSEVELLIGGNETSKSYGRVQIGRVVRIYSVLQKAIHTCSARMLKSVQTRSLSISTFRYF